MKQIIKVVYFDNMLKNDFFKNFDKYQLQAIKDNSRILLVHAGPGSGKTHTLVGKIIYLLDQGISPLDLLILVFSNKAKLEIDERIDIYIKKFLGSDFDKKVRAYTFHSYFLKKINQKNQSFNLKLITQKQKINIISNLIKQNFPKISLNKRLLKDIDLFISLKKMQQYHNFNDDEFLNFVFDLYIRQLKEQNLMDFDDILLIAKNEKSFFEKKYLLVDEFQDLNNLQLDIIKQFFKFRGTCMFAIGDENQSIYGFRGSISNIFSDPFFKTYNAKILYLKNNFRNSKNIIFLANNFLKNNLNINVFNKEEEKVHVIKTLDSFYQARFIAKQIEEIIGGFGLESSFLKQNDNDVFSDIAVLIRSKKQIPPLINIFLKKNIPFVVKNDSFFDKKFVQILVSFYIYFFLKDLRLLEHSFSLLNNKSSFFDLEFYITNLDIDVLKKTDFKTIDKDTLLDTGFDKTILNNLYDDFYNSDTLSQVFLNFNKTLVNIKTYKKISKNFNDFFIFISSFKKKDLLFLFDFFVKRSFFNKKVHILTFHASKGLEYKYVFIPDLNKGIVPLESKNNRKVNLFEEKRLFYVALTRAKNKLFLLYTDDKKPSKFLDSLDKSYILFEKQKSFDLFKKRKLNRQVQKSQGSLF